MLLQIKNKKDIKDIKSSVEVISALQVLEEEKIISLYFVEKGNYIVSYSIIVIPESLKQIDNIINNLLKKWKDQGLSIKIKKEGSSESGWCLIDIGDCFIHLITKEKLEHYQLIKTLSEEIVIE